MLEREFEEILTKIDEEISIEYRVRNSSTEEDLREVVITDVIPTGLEITSFGENCLGENLLMVVCRFDVFPAKRLEKLKLTAIVKEDFLKNPVNPKDSEPLVTAEGRNKLTELVFTLKNYQRMLESEEFF